MVKYDPLEEFLQRQPGPTIMMLFADVAELVGGLPNSAYRHPAWWANDSSGSHTHATAWLSARWLIDGVDLQNRRVVFRRVSGSA